MDITLVDEFDARIAANADALAAKTLLVTGANSGVGLQVSMNMAALGAKVRSLICGQRSPSSSTLR